MAKVTGYLRVSTSKQDSESQRAVVERYAIGRGLIVTDWVDETESGAKDWEARKLGDLIRTAQAGDVLIVSEVSRLARSLLGVLQMAKTMADNGAAVQVANINLAIDGSFNSQAMIVMMGLAAEWERSILMQRTKAGLENARAKAEEEGRAMGTRGKAKKYKLDSRKAEIVGLLAKEISKTAIAKLCGVSRQTLDAWIKLRIAEQQ